MSEKFTLDTLQAFWVSRPNGARLQYKSYFAKADWRLVTDDGPGLNSFVNDWRWEPQSIPVDLSSLVGSDVLCRFGHGIQRLGFLKEVVNGTGFVDQDRSLWKQCRPVMNKWMAVDRDLVIPEGLGCSEISLKGWAGNFKLVLFSELKEGYQWPWEDKE